MPLDKRYLKSTITQINENSYILTITFSWYGIWNFEETYPSSSIEEAKKKLIEVRSGVLGFIGIDGKLNLF
jgi:hypothetical protein